MSNKRIHALVLDTDDRILKISLAARDLEGLMFFYKGRELYFVSYLQLEDGLRIFRSWTGNYQFSEKADFSVFDEVGRQKVNGKQESEYLEIEKLLEQEKELQLKVLNKELEKFNKKRFRKIHNIEGDLNRVRQWRNLQELVEKENLETFSRKSVLHGIKFQFEKEGHFARRSQVYQKIKNLKSAEELLLRRLDEEKIKVSKQQKEIKGLLPALPPVWSTGQQKIKEKEERKEEYQIIHYPDFDLGLGLSAKGNDQLRNSWGKKDDFWIHLDNETSAHGIIKIKNPQIQIMDILDQIKGHFKKTGEMDMLYTKLKNVKSVKGAPGKVIYSKEKRVRLVND